MKLISLNTWGGRAGKEPLLDFFRRNDDVDIFCLQEVWNGGQEATARIAGGVPLIGITYSLLPDIAACLPEHDAYFRPQYKEHYGLVMFIKKKLKVKEEGEVFVYKERGFYREEDIGDHSRNIQYAIVDTPSGPRAILQLHGLWNGKGKTDTEDRLLQSDRIVDFMKTIKAPLVFCGDLNLLPETESFQRIKNAGLRDLVGEFNITSTRSSLYKKDVRFADYAFAGEGIVVKDFRVLLDEVSDHLPLYLEFE